MKIEVTVVQKGYRYGKYEVDIPPAHEGMDKFAEEDHAIDAAYVLAKDVKWEDPRIVWGDWMENISWGYPDPDDIETTIKQETV